MRLWYLSQVTSEFSGGSAHPHSLARAFAVRTKGPTKHHTSSTTRWLRMRDWRMSLRRMKSAIISWDRSFIEPCAWCTHACSCSFAESYTNHARRSGSSVSTLTSRLHKEWSFSKVQKFTLRQNSKEPHYLDDRWRSSSWAASWQNQQNGMCAQRRLRSALASAQSDQSLHCPLEESLGPWLPIKRTAKSDQTRRMPKLIWVFAWRTCHFIGFVTLRLIIISLSLLSLFLSLSLSLTYY